MFVNRDPLRGDPCLKHVFVCLVICLWLLVNVGGHDPGTEPPSVDPKTGTSHRIGNSPQTIGKALKLARIKLLEEWWILRMMMMMMMMIWIILTGLE